MKKTVLILALLLSALSLPAQQAAKPVEKKEVQVAVPKCPFVEVLNIAPVALKTYPAEVKIERGVVYAQRSGMDLHMNFYSPDGAKNSLPCVLFIKGSAWKKQNINTKDEALAALAAKGYVVASMEYRPVDVAKIPAQKEDALTALEFLRENAARYGIDKENMFVWGTSSGGHTALLAGFNPQAQVNAIVEFYGPSDLRAQIEGTERKVSDYVNISEGDSLEKINKEVSPIYYVEKGVPPTLIFHGDVDPLVPFSQSDDLAIKLKKADVPVVFYCVSGGAHGSPHFWGAEIVGYIDNFLRDYMK